MEYLIEIVYIPVDIENVRWYCPAGKTNTARLSGKTAKRSFSNPSKFIGGWYTYFSHLKEMKEMKNNSLLMIFVTVPTPDVATTIGKTLVTERLIACANIIPNIRSIYNWQGTLENSEEVLMILKAPTEYFGKVEKRLLELHPYDTPELIALAPEEVTEKYLRWALQNCIP